jgi:dTDP-4-dehydrorhamnose reductase/2-polyprenyl-3-methyl-5-hydroxy-6-metoxy-1,4-benzoquinol methylase
MGKLNNLGSVFKTRWWGWERMTNQSNPDVKLAPTLVIGADSEIGSAIIEFLSKSGVHSVFGTSRRPGKLRENFFSLDLENPMYETLPQNIDFVVFCAGISGEELCQLDPDRAYQVNVEATKQVLDFFIDRGAFVVFLSSNLVFDGGIPFPTTDMSTSPRGLYGSLKSEVERHLSPSNNAAVLRLTKVLTAKAPLIRDWKAKADSGSRIEVFSDVMVSPISVEQVCEAVELILKRAQSGVFHLGSVEESSFADFAKRFYSSQPEVLQQLYSVERNAGGAVEHNSLQTKLPTRENQYQPLAEFERFPMGLMSGHAYLSDPKRLAFTLSRYKFVSKMIAGSKSVLEVGCADAFGSPIVAEEVQALTAVDFDSTFIADAKKNHPFRHQINFFQHDLLKAPVPGHFDAVYAMDVLEHIEIDLERQFLDNLVGSLEQHGVCIIGMPSTQSQVYASEISRLGHVNCKTADELRATMLRHFTNVFIFSMNDEVVHTGYHPMAQYLIALSCNLR